MPPKRQNHQNDDDDDDDVTTSSISNNKASPPVVKAGPWPFPVYFNVIQFSDVETLCVTRRVCSSFRDLSEWPHLWEYLIRRDFPHYDLRLGAAKEFANNDHDVAVPASYNNNHKNKGTPSKAAASGKKGAAKATTAAAAATSKPSSSSSSNAATPLAQRASFITAIGDIFFCEGRACYAFVNLAANCPVTLSDIVSRAVDPSKVALAAPGAAATASTKKPTAPTNKNNSNNKKNNNSGKGGNKNNASSAATATGSSNNTSYTPPNANIQRFTTSPVAPGDPIKKELSRFDRQLLCAGAKILDEAPQQQQNNNNKSAAAKTTTTTALPPNQQRWGRDMKAKALEQLSKTIPRLSGFDPEPRPPPTRREFFRSFLCFHLGHGVVNQTSELRSRIGTFNDTHPRFHDALEKSAAWKEAKKKARQARRSINVPQANDNDDDEAKEQKKKSNEQKQQQPPPRIVDLPRHERTPRMLFCDLVYLFALWNPWKKEAMPKLVMAGNNTNKSNNNSKNKSNSINNIDDADDLTAEHKAELRQVNKEFPPFLVSNFCNASEAPALNRHYIERHLAADTTPFTWGLVPSPDAVMNQNITESVFCFTPVAIYAAVRAFSYVVSYGLPKSHEELSETALVRFVAWLVSVVGEPLSMFLYHLRVPDPLPIIENSTTVDPERNFLVAALLWPVTTLISLLAGPEPTTPTAYLSFLAFILAGVGLCEYAQRTIERKIRWLPRPNPVYYSMVCSAPSRLAAPFLVSGILCSFSQFGWWWSGGGGVVDSAAGNTTETTAAAEAAAVSTIAGPYPVWQEWLPSAMLVCTVFVTIASVISFVDGLRHTAEDTKLEIDTNAKAFSTDPFSGQTRQNCGYIWSSTWHRSRFRTLDSIVETTQRAYRNIFERKPSEFIAAPPAADSNSGSSETAKKENTAKKRHAMLENKFLIEKEFATRWWPLLHGVQSVFLCWGLSYLMVRGFNIVWLLGYYAVSTLLMNFVTGWVARADTWDRIKMMI